MKYDQGLIFSSNGRVIDPEERTLLGTVTGLDDKTLVAPDHAAGQVFYLTGDGPTRQLRIVASNSFLPLESLAVPNVRGQPVRLIRWGQGSHEGAEGSGVLRPNIRLQNAHQELRVWCLGQHFVPVFLEQEIAGTFVPQSKQT